MAYSDRMMRSHLYTVFFAPRGFKRMADLGMQVAAQYLSPFDKLIGLVGEAGSGKSMLIRGMFPGLELTNDDEGVNIRPLPLLSAAEDATGFYSAHTYHLDIRFESAFTQMHVLAEAILEAIDLGKRVIVEHFDLIYPMLGRNAHLLIGIGEEVMITRPTLFGPEPHEIAEVVFKTLPVRRMVHSAEDVCSYLMTHQGVSTAYDHGDVLHGFVLGFPERPELDLDRLEHDISDMIAANVPITYMDESHIKIDGHPFGCSGPRMHVRATSEIRGFTLHKELLLEPIGGRYLLVGTVGEQGRRRLSGLNRIRRELDEDADI